jgi:hypothetical protein
VEVGLGSGITFNFFSLITKLSDTTLVVGIKGDTE